MPSQESKSPKIVNSIRKRSGFAKIPNAAAIDLSISDGALRVYLYMSTKPDDWLFNNRDIQHKLNIKRSETIAKYWKELITSGWISRQPVLNSNGRPTGYFDYVINFEPIKPVPENTEVVSPTTDKPSADSQQILDNSSYSNNEVITNNNNTPSSLIKENVGGVWFQLIKNLALKFNENELTAIDVWFNYLTGKIHGLNIGDIESDLLILAKYKSDNYNIVELINDTKRSKFRGLLKPSINHLIGKPSGSTSHPKKDPAYRFNNPEYFVPENDLEANRIVDKVVDWYKNGINPKNRNKLTNSEISHIKLHMDNAAQANIKWNVYVKNYEVISCNSLLDKPVSEIVIAHKSIPANIQKLLDRKNSKSNNKDGMNNYV